MSALSKQSADDNPLTLLPDAMRPDVSLFFGCYSDVLKGTLGLSSSISVWVQSDGLTADELRPILRKLLSASERAQIQYAGQLLSRLAAMVAESTDRRKARDRQQADRDQAERDRAGAAKPADWRKITAGIGQPV